MIRLFLLLAFIPLSGLYSLGEYNGYFVKFEIQTKTDNHITGHMYVASAYIDMDSINNPDYLIRALDRLDYQGTDTLVFFDNRLTYVYKSFGNTTNDTIYTLVGKHSIPTNSIRSISITEMIDFGYLMGIASEHTLADAVWMDKKPVQRREVQGYLCSWLVFVHASTDKTRKIMAELDRHERTAQTRLDEFKANYEQEDGTMDREKSWEYDDLEESIQNETHAILEKFKGERVVIVAFCTC